MCVCVCACMRIVIPIRSSRSRTRNATELALRVSRGEPGLKAYLLHPRMLAQPADTFPLGAIATATESQVPVVRFVNEQYREHYHAFEQVFSRKLQEKVAADEEARRQQDASFRTELGYESLADTRPSAERDRSKKLRRNRSSPTGESEAAHGVPHYARPRNAARRYRHRPTEELPPAGAADVQDPSPVPEVVPPEPAPTAVASHPRRSHSTAHDILQRNVQLVCAWQPKPIRRVYGFNIRSSHPRAPTPHGDDRSLRSALPVSASLLLPRPPSPRCALRLLGGGVPPTAAEVALRHAHQSAILSTRHELASGRRRMLLEAVRARHERVGGAAMPRAVRVPSAPEARAVPPSLREVRCERRRVAEALAAGWFTQLLVLRSLRWLSTASNDSTRAASEHA